MIHKKTEYSDGEIKFEKGKVDNDFFEYLTNFEIDKDHMKKTILSKLVRKVL